MAGAIAVFNRSVDSSGRTFAEHACKINMCAFQFNGKEHSGNETNWRFKQTFLLAVA